jgi:two-component system phosphate regulon sensor histidine kinase PhoR
LERLDKTEALEIARLRQPTLPERAARLWRPLALLATVFVALILFGSANPLLSLLGFAVTAAVLLSFAEQRVQIAPPAAQQRTPAALSPRSEALLESLPDPAIIIDKRALVLFANQPARSLLPTLKIGNPLSFTLRAPDVLDAVEDVLAGTPIADVEYIERVPVERSFNVRIAALTPISQPTQEAVREAASLMFRDTTPMRRVEHMRVDFVANASHELRTPLASLLGFIETLQGPARNDAVARERFLAIMSEQARRMARLIDDLLSLSRIELNAHVKPTSPVEIVGVVRHIIDALSPMARDRAVELTLEVAGSSEIVVDGDRDELLRVFENLIENAIKYGSSGGRVDVTIDHAGEHAREVTVHVRDYGPGISPEHVPRLTERFYRVDVAASRDKGGTGLGLAIVKHIVNRHHGRFHVESSPGEGAVFSVSMGVAARRIAK